MGLQWSRYFCYQEGASKLTLEMVIRLDMETSMLGLLGSRFSLVGLAGQAFYLPRCDGGTGFDQLIKANRRNLTVGWIATLM